MSVEDPRTLTPEQWADKTRDLDARRQLQIARQRDRISAFVGYLAETGKTMDFNTYDAMSRHTDAVTEWAKAHPERSPETGRTV